MTAKREIPDDMAKDSRFVLFDEDYRSHIALLNKKLERERQEVILLRERLARLERIL